MLNELRTERLFIRRVKVADKQSIRDIWAALAQTPYAQYDKPNPLDEDTVTRRVEHWASCHDSDAHLFLSVLLGERVIGYIALHRRGNSYEIGYGFHPAFHNKGYARESIGAVLRNMKSHGTDRFEAGTALQNTPSVRLLTALGFTLTRTEKVSFCRDENGSDIYFDGGIFELIL